MPYRSTVRPAVDRPVRPRRRRRSRALLEVAVPRRPRTGPARRVRPRQHRKSQVPREAVAPKRCHKKERHPAAGRLRTRRMKVRPAAARPGRLRQAAGHQAPEAAHRAVATRAVVAEHRAVATRAVGRPGAVARAGRYRGAGRTSRRPVTSAASQVGVAIPGPEAAVHLAGVRAGIPVAGGRRRSSGRRLWGRREAVGRPVPTILHLVRARRVRGSDCRSRREARAPEGACSRTRRPPVIVSARISVRRPLRAYRCTPGQRALPAPESPIPRLANALSSTHEHALPDARTLCCAGMNRLRAAQHSVRE